MIWSRALHGRSAGDETGTRVEAYSQRNSYSTKTTPRTGMHTLNNWVMADGLAGDSASSFDGLLRRKLDQELDDTAARDFYSAYERAKLDLRKEVLKEIGKVEPNLTDHGPDHVENVLENALRLVPSETEQQLSAVEMYFLGMIILFHDAGNILGRDGHRSKVAPVFAKVRGGKPSLLHERTLVIRATQAHSGTGRDGTRDTLKDLALVDHLAGKPIRLLELAAILRFADELAEGPQRTSAFMQSEGLYDDNSMPYHEYASRTHILIDRPRERIVASYEIDVPSTGTSASRKQALSRMLRFVYKRILKMNQERQYARFYSNLLSPFKATEVSFNFHCGIELLQLDLAPLRLTDIVVPGDRGTDVNELDPAYSVDSLVDRLLDQCPTRSSEE